MVIGLVGLLAMAAPAFARHGHAHPVRGHAPPLARGAAARAHSLGAGRGGAAAAARGAQTAGRNEIIAATPTSTSLLRFLPSPRAICSVLALYGAFGNALVHAAHLPFWVAVLAALPPALLVEWFVVRPVWNLVFRFEGRPSSPMADLILSEATAVVPFRNGRGVVSAIRDGRIVQLAARLADDQSSLAVKVGDRLRIEDVDAERERVTVSLLTEPPLLPR